jgi:hypothetical protein
MRPVQLKLQTNLRQRGPLFLCDFSIRNVGHSIKGIGCHDLLLVWVWPFSNNLNTHISVVSKTDCLFLT